jgi:predicted nuclease of predicted toxin-antitoxin system
LTIDLYLDDCIFSHVLRRLLLLAGFRVVIPADVGLSGARDREHFAYARDHGLTLVTRDPDDFLLLHGAQSDHAGLLLVYRENNPARDMSAVDIVRAIQNILAAGIPIAGQVHVLNHWRY